MNNVHVLIAAAPLLAAPASAQQLQGAPYLAEGEAAVVRPLGKDFEIVARVRHDGWRAPAGR